jgi:mitochondrial chaperone BCS1
MILTHHFKGFGLASLGVIAAISRQGLKRGATLLRKRLLVDLEITKNDDSYQWLLQWMSAYHRRRANTSGTSELFGKATKRGAFSSFLDRFTPRMRHLQIQTCKTHRADGSSHTHFTLVPGPGTHVIRYGNAFIWITRQREKSFDLQTGTPFETVLLTTLFAHRNVFEELFTEAHRLAQQMQEGKTVIFTSWGTEWRPFGQPKRKRPLDSVVLEPGIKERVIKDVRAFLEARTWYLDRGIPYRRGYLLYGPPGTGKSSFIQALAGELDFNIGILNLSERGLTDDRLNHLLTNVPPRTIILLEDADAAFSNRTQVDEHGYRGATVTFSGLLNALDGVASAEERIVFLTTNHVQNLDKALVRPGRIDLAVRLGEATDVQIDQLWDRFYADFDRDGTGKQKFQERALRLGLVGVVSPAALQGLFLVNKGNMQGAIDNVHNLAPLEKAKD